MEMKAPFKGSTWKRRAKLLSSIIGLWLVSAVLTAVSARCLDTVPLRVEPQIGPTYPRVGTDIHQVAFHPKDPAVLLVLEGQGVSLWNVANPDNPQRFLTLRTPALDAAFLPDGRTIVTSGQDGRLRWWGMDGAPASNRSSLRRG